MPIKLFISYSEKDELFRKEFETHLANLKRQGLVSTWHFRKIIPSQNWDNEIHQNLKDSSIIIFLMSPDFFASEYCMGEEVKRALMQSASKISQIIPIVIRPCDWSSSEFAKRKFEGLPEDMKPISVWHDKDEAWLSVVNGLKRLLSLIGSDRHDQNPQEEMSLQTMRLKESFISHLNSTGITFQHPHKEKVSLFDLFVYPDLRERLDKIETIQTTVSSGELSMINDNYCVFGDEQSGKTSLCYKLILDLIKINRIPILLSGTSLGSSEGEKALRETLVQQYDSINDGDIIQRQNLVVIIDDFTESKLNSRGMSKFLNYLRSRNHQIIIFASSNMQIYLSDIDYLKSFKFYEIMPFGHLRRSELIEKWISLGQEETIADDYLMRQITATELHIDRFVRQNIVPSKPIFLLSILQVLESFAPTDLKLTAYGHCYQYLIQSLLNKVKIKASEIDKYINYLTELAYFMFSKRAKKLSDSEFAEFRRTYSERFLAVDHNAILSNLVNCKIIINDNDEFRFNYKYVYYFYVAKYISDYYNHDKNIKIVFEELIKNLHMSEYANIIIFITHHSNDPAILDDIQLAMMEIHEREDEATLSRDELLFLQEFITGLPKLIIEQKDPRREHDKMRKRLDDNNDAEPEDDEELAKNETVMLINKTFKSIEIIGQIIRNRHSSLLKDVLEQVTGCAYGTGLRFIKYFLSLSDRYKMEIISFIKDLLKDNPNISEEDLERQARGTFLFLTYNTIFSLIRRISLSIGSLEAKEIYDRMYYKRNTASCALINISIELHFTKSLDIDYLNETYESLSGNIVAQRIFKAFIIEHIYLHGASWGNKQKIASKFGIPIKSQLLMEGKKSSII